MDVGVAGGAQPHHVARAVGVPVPDGPGPAVVEVPDRGGDEAPFAPVVCPPPDGVAGCVGRVVAHGVTQARQAPKVTETWTWFSTSPITVLMSPVMKSSPIGTKTPQLSQVRSHRSRSSLVQSAGGSVSGVRMTAYPSGSPPIVSSIRSYRAWAAAASHSGATVGVSVMVAPDSVGLKGQNLEAHFNSHYKYITSARLGPLALIRLRTRAAPT